MAQSITAFFLTLILAILICVKGSDNAKGGSQSVSQSNRVNIWDSDIGGSLDIKAVNNANGKLSHLFTHEPTTEPTHEPSASPTLVPTESPFFPPPSGSVSCGCSDIETEVVEVRSPITGRIYMDRNLGASRRALSYQDSYAYGCLFQWGRGRDGGASMNWTSSSNGKGVTGSFQGPVPDPFPACTDGEQFVTLPYRLRSNWLNYTNNTLWETGSLRDPCPAGFQVPSKEEWEAELVGIPNITAAYDQLALTAAGLRDYQSGDVNSAGFNGFYWTRTNSSGVDSYVAIFLDNDVYSDGAGHAFGLSVRCIKVV